MAKTWKHPDWGEFEDDGAGAWIGTIDLPGFEAFGGGRGIEVVFEPGDQGEAPGDPPGELQVAALVDFLAQTHTAGLAQAILDAVWDDLCGEGPGSAHWWAGDLKQVNENQEDYGEEPIAGKDDLASSMPVGSIHLGGGRGGAVEVGFSPMWEDEHGVGVLVAEGKVIGLGYQGNIEPFA